MMILFLGKTDRGQLIVECSTSIISCEDCFVLIDKPDNVAKDSLTIGKYKTLTEVREAAQKYLEEEIPL